MAGGRAAGEGGGEGGCEEEEKGGGDGGRTDDSHQETSAGGNGEEKKVYMYTLFCTSFPCKNIHNVVPIPAHKNGLFKVVGNIQLTQSL